MPAPSRRPIGERLTAVLAVTTAAAALGLAGPPASAQPTALPSAQPATRTAPVAATSTARWVETATRAFGYQGTRLGATAPQTPVQLTVTLEPRHAAAMERAVHAVYTPGSGRYHHYLTPSQWNARYAPTRASVAAVSTYLRRSGFTHLQPTGNRMAVLATGTVAQAERAFDTRIVDVDRGGSTVFGNLTPARVPARLGGIVDGVLGLNDLPNDLVRPQRVTSGAATAAAPTADGSPSFAGLLPAPLAKVYGTDGLPTGAPVSVAVLTVGDQRPVIASLRYAEKKEKAPRVPVTVVPVGQQLDESFAEEEWDMDTQMATIGAGRVKRLYLYNIGGLQNSQVAADLAAFVSDDVATALSASIGGCEANAFLDGTESFVDIAMQQGALQGQSIMASSGDAGDSCPFLLNAGAPLGPPEVEWPAAGSFTLAVGGTSLVTDTDGHRIQELGWLGSGGGLSAFENAASWTRQTNIGAPLGAITGGRAVPDIALDADANLTTPGLVYVGKTLVGIGGTSLSSPLMLGIWARLQAAHHGTLGLAPAALYAAYDTATYDHYVGLGVTDPTAATAPGFTDVTAGVNGLYTAGPGWDYVTGLGTPDAAALSAVLK